MEIYLSDDERDFERTDKGFKRDPKAEMELLACRPDITYQTIDGFGAAFTEAAAYTFAQMPPSLQDEFLRLCFTGDAAHPDSGGNNYTICRTPIQSCDFALGNYAYVAHGDHGMYPGKSPTIDTLLQTFSIERDREFLLPLIQCAQLISPALSLLATPWSPPAFMKTNINMNYGGRLRPKYYAHWAALIVAYLQAYAEAGVTIRRLTVQNEPSAAQSWDSCLFSPREEATYARDFLRPALEAAGLGDVQLFMWDHNKDQVLERTEAVCALAGEGVFDGVAFHWYAGDHFESIAELARRFPKLALYASEGCVEYLRNFFVKGPDAAGHAYHYAHDILGDLTHGARAFIDWNMLLDEEGGPNHAKNYCEAPLMYRRDEQELVVNRSFGAIGHFSRFIEPGARRFFTSCHTSRLECGGFVNPDGTRVVIAVNGNEVGLGFKLYERPWSARVDLPAHSVATVRWTPDEVARTA